MQVSAFSDPRRVRACGRVVWISDGPCDVMCVRMSPNSRLIAAGFANGEIKVSHSLTITQVVEGQRWCNIAFVFWVF